MYTRTIGFDGDVDPAMLPAHIADGLRQLDVLFNPFARKVSDRAKQNNRVVIFYDKIWLGSGHERLAFETPCFRRTNRGHYAVAMSERTSMKKIKPSDLRREAVAMIRDGSMPPLETVQQAVADVREKYADEIKASRSRRGSASSC